MANVTHIDASAFERAGASVADSLVRAARPGRVPSAMAGTSPADAAASAVAAAMSTKVTDASALLAPRGPKIRAASQAAAAGFRASDERNAALLQAVPATMGQTAAGAGGSSVQAADGSAKGGIQMVSDGWDDPAEPHRILPGYWEDDFGGYHNAVEEPIDPGGAAAGGPGYGRPPV